MFGGTGGACKSDALKANILKAEVLKQIIAQLQMDLRTLEQAVELARDTATHADCLGSSKYETMGLEASYLAQGQGVRLLEVERALEYFKALDIQQSHAEITLSSVVVVQDESAEVQVFWLAAQAGGLKLQCGSMMDSTTITVITPQAPFGRILMGKVASDEFEFGIGSKQSCYEIVEVY